MHSIFLSPYFATIQAELGSLGVLHHGLYGWVLKFGSDSLDYLGLQLYIHQMLFTYHI
jgi:hypothetical protein